MQRLNLRKLTKLMSTPHDAQESETPALPLGDHNWGLQLDLGYNYDYNPEHPIQLRLALVTSSLDALLAPRGLGSVG